jgi:hypothetical protein
MNIAFGYMLNVVKFYINTLSIIYYHVFKGILSFTLVRGLEILRTGTGWPGDPLLIGAVKG